MASIECPSYSNLVHYDMLCIYSHFPLKVAPLLFLQVLTSARLCAADPYMYRLTDDTSRAGWYSLRKYLSSSFVLV